MFVFPIGLGYWRADVFFFRRLMLNYIGFGLGANGTHGFLEKKERKKERNRQHRGSQYITTSLLAITITLVHPGNCKTNSAVTAETTMKMKFQFASNVFLNDL